MKIVIIGNPESKFIKDYIEKILLTMDYEITLVGPFRENRNADIYTKNNIKKIDLRGKYSKNRLVNYIVTLFSVMKKAEKYDVMHVHSVGASLKMRLVYDYFALRSKKLILTFWGSDLLATDYKYLKKLKRLVNNAVAITISTKELMEKLTSVFRDIDKNKISKCYFGIDMITYFENNANALVDNPKEVYGIAENKYVIAIGYNGAKRQQHIKVISELKKLPNYILENIFVVLQFSYGVESSEYKTEVENYLKEMNIEFVIIEDFLDAKSTINMKSCIDMFIHGQTTDALSASVIEYIYMGSHVISPTWIEYSELKNAGITYLEFDDFDVLPNLVSDIYEGRIEPLANLENREKIVNKFSWEAASKEWIKLYE